jgi:hypothetical protein
MGIMGGMVGRRLVCDTAAVRGGQNGGSRKRMRTRTIADEVIKGGLAKKAVDRF